MIIFPKTSVRNKPELSIKKFKGIYQGVDDVLVSIENAVSAQNCEVKDGVLRRCKGDTIYNIATLATAIVSLMTHYADGVGTILASSAGKLYKLSTNAWVQISSGYAVNEWRYVNYQKEVTDITIMTNGSDAIMVYNGAGFRNLKNRAAIHDETGAIIYWLDGDGTTHATEAECTAAAPVGKYIALFKERLFIADSKGFYFSKDMDPDDFTAPTDEIEVNEHGGYVELPTFDAGQIIGLKALWDDLMLFKTNTVHRLFGTYPGNYDLITVFTCMNGHILDKTITAGRNISFWTTTKGVYAYFGGTGDSDLTPAIKEEFSKVNSAAIDTSIAVMYGNRYILAMPEGTSLVPNMVLEYEIETKQWMVKRGMSISTFLTIGEVLIYADGDGKLHQYDIGDSNNGVAISSFFETGRTYMTNKTFCIDEVNFVGSGNGSVKISCITDIRTTSVIVPLTATEKAITRDLTNEGKIISFKFENVSGSDFSIKQPQFIGSIDID